MVYNTFLGTVKDVNMKYHISSNLLKATWRSVPFFAPKGGDFSREGNYLRKAIISNISHRRLCPKYFVSLYLVH